MKEFGTVVSDPKTESAMPDFGVVVEGKSQESAQFGKVVEAPDVPLHQHPFVLNTLADESLSADQQKAVIERYGETYAQKYGVDTGVIDSFKTNFQNAWDNYNTLGAILRKKKLGGAVLEATDAAKTAAQKQSIFEQEAELAARESGAKEEPGVLRRALTAMTPTVNMIGSPAIGDVRNKKTEVLKSEIDGRKQDLIDTAKDQKKKRYEGLLDEAVKQAEYAALNSEGFMENVAAFTGVAAGAILDPINLVPVAKPLQGASLGTKLGVRALEGAAVNAAVNPMLQDVAQEANQQSGFEWGQFFADSGFGALGGAGFSLLGEGAGRLLNRFKVDPAKVEGQTAVQAMETIARESGASAEDVAKALEVEITNPTLKATIEQRLAKETLKDVESLPEVIRKQADEVLPEPQRIQRKLDAVAESSEPPLKPEQVEKLPKVERDLIAQRPELGNEKSLEQIRKRTRGVVTDEAAIAKAKELDWTEESIANIKQGQTLNKEQILATKGVVLDHTQRLQGLRERLRGLDPDSGEASLLRAQVAAMNVENVAMWQTQRAVAAETGRALQSFKVNMEPINVAMNRVAKALNDPKMPKDAKDYLVKAVAEADGDADEVLSLLRKIPRASKTEMLVEMATAMKLSGKQTQLVNLITSKARQVVMVAETVLGATIDAVESVITRKPRERFFTEAFAEIMGMEKGYQSVPYHLKRLLTDEEYSLRMRSNQDFYNGKAPAIRGRFGKNTLYDQLMDVAGLVIRLPFRGLSAGDIIVRSPVEMGAAYRLAARDAAKKGLKFNSPEWKTHVSKFVAEPDASALDAIKDAGNRVLFQRDPESVLLRKLGEVRNAAPATKLVIPFFRTLNDLVKTGVEFSPVAPVLGNVRRQLASKGDRAEALGRMAMGTTLWLNMVQYAAEGNITAAPPKTKAERDKWERTGKLPYSIKIGDQWVAYNRMAPFSYFMVSAESMTRALQNEDGASALDQMAGFIGEMGQMLIDQNFMLGVSDLLEALQDPERKGSRFLENLVVGATYPNILAEEARAIDPVIRDVKSDKDSPVASFFDQLANAYKARIPFVSKQLPPQMNVWGQERVRPGTDSYLERSWNPLRISQPHVDVVESELDALGYTPGFPGKQSFGFDMSNEQYRMMLDVSGDAIYRILFNLIPSEGYQRLTPMQREYVIDSVFSGIRKPARLLAAPENYVDSMTVQYLRQMEQMTTPEAIKVVEAQRRAR